MPRLPRTIIFVSKLQSLVKSKNRGRFVFLGFSIFVVSWEPPTVQCGKPAQTDDCPKKLTRSFLQCASSPRQKGSNPHANEDFQVWKHRAMREAIATGQRAWLYTCPNACGRSPRIAIRWDEAVFPGRAFRPKFPDMRCTKRRSLFLSIERIR